MNASDKVVFFFGCLGAFNGLLLGIYFLFLTAKKHLSGYLLAALLLVLSIRVGKSVVYFFDYNLPKTYLQIGLTACFFIGPFTYFYTKAETSQIRKLPGSWRWQLILWAFIIGGVGIVYPYVNYPQRWREQIIPLIYLQWGVYVFLSVGSVLPLLKKITLRESIKPFEKGVLTIVGTVALLFGSYVCALLNISKGSYIQGALWFSLIIYTVVFTLLYRRKTHDLFSAATKYAKTMSDLPEAERLLERLLTVMSEKKLFKNPDLKVDDLARELNVSGHYVSRLVNDKLGKNFTRFVNEYRIHEACHILSRPTHLTIEAVGDEVGFNSKSTFFASFKKIKGTTPSVYQQSMTPDL
ncbi:helix-turn-helix domain-containing protein [Larkinella sp. VNQ87]|uniref:helix-turn-helix domain-containing protein n=1 Tax=Larkinella sp. VNQ87 TaxID=3400921 RepID=UPI003C12ACD6